MLSFLPKKPDDVLKELRSKLKARRKSMGITQTELSNRSGVSLGSLKRFETTGQIALESLLKLAFVLECLDGFGSLFEVGEKMPESIEDILYEG